MTFSLDGEGAALDTLLKADDMAHQSLPPVQYLDNYTLPSPVSRHAELQSRTQDWVNRSHYQGSDPARHSSHAPDALNGIASARHEHKLPNLYTLQPQPGHEIRSPKREIKRRTKTGCLTCRRRRIKCDEGQPTCGNCRKSKRECLGYDPIFKTTGLHGPVPTNAYSPSLQSPVHQLQRHFPSQPSPYSHAPARLSPTQQSAGPYGVPLDPSLGGGVPGLRSYRLRKHATMDNLFLADGLSPSIFPSATSSSVQISSSDTSEITAIWRSQYSGMLDSFFETQWYSQVGDSWLHNNANSFDFFAHCNQQFKARQNEPAALACLEARLVWLLAELPRTAWAAKQQADAQLADLLHRLDVVEHLLTGSILPPNLIPPVPVAPPRLPGRPEQAPTAEYLSHSFWHHLGTFTAADDATPPSHANQHSQAKLVPSLQSMRHILSMLENRDVLYSVAVSRHFAGRLEQFDPGQGPPPAPDPPDPEHPFAKLAVALRFLADEEMSGTTAIVRAMAGLARRGVARSRMDDG